MACSTLSFIALFALVSGTLSAPPVGIKATPRDFSCEYFSTGRYLCNYDNDVKPSGIVGRWTPDDGIWSDYDPSGPERKIGQCSFSTDGSGSCSGMPRFWTDDQGNQSGVGGGMTQIPHYTGEPGGRIRAGLPVGVPPK